MNYKEICKRGLLLISVLIVGIAVGCPIYKIFKVPCPCCGVTRAWLCLFRGDIKGAFAYNPLFVLIALVAVAFTFEEILFKRTWKKNVFFCVSGGIIFLQYIVRIL